MRKRTKLENFVNRYLYDTTAPGSLPYKSFLDLLRILASIAYIPIFIGIINSLPVVIPNVIYYFFLYFGTLILLIPIQWRHYFVKVLIRFEIQSKQPFKKFIKQIRILVQKKVT